MKKRTTLDKYLRYLRLLNDHTHVWEEAEIRGLKKFIFGGLQFGLRGFGTTPSGILWMHLHKITHNAGFRGWEITPEQTQKGLAWLRKMWYRADITLDEAQRIAWILQNPRGRVR